MSYYMLSLESLFVRSNRISMCCIITVLSLESLFVRSNRISVACYSIESEISICTVKSDFRVESGISICTVK